MLLYVLLAGETDVIAAHWGHVHTLAAFLIIDALLFAAVAKTVLRGITRGKG